MKKAILFFVIITTLTIVLTSCDKKTNVEINNISIDELVTVSKPYKDDKNLLTKNDIAVWLVEIINCLESDNYRLSDIANSENRSQNLIIAIKSGILCGSNIEMDDEKLATKEEAMVMLKRAIIVEPQLVDLSTILSYQDYTDISFWAKQSVADVVYVLLNAGDDYLLQTGIHPKENITQEDMISMIDTVIESDYNYLLNMGTLDKLKRKLFKIKTFYVVLGGTGIFAITCIIKLLYSIYIKYQIKKEIIYLGEKSSGKTELSKVLPDPNKPRKYQRYSPTRSVYNSPSVRIKDLKGYTIFYGIAKDIPGGSNDALLEFLRSHKFKHSGKIIIIILSHNKGLKDTNIDFNYIEEQYVRLDKVYIPAMKHYKKRISKVIIFINKCDNLPEGYQNDWYNTQETIYKKHFNLLNKELSNSVNLQVVAGSATKRINIEKLRNLLY